MVDPEVKLLAGEAVAVLFDVGPGYDGHLLAGDGASCRTDRQTGAKINPLKEGDDGEGHSAELQYHHGEAVSAMLAVLEPPAKSFSRCNSSVVKDTHTVVTWRVQRLNQTSIMCRKVVKIELLSLAGIDHTH